MLQRIDKRVKEVITPYIDNESRRIVSNIVNNATFEVIDQQKIKKLITVEKNAEGKIELINYNTKEINTLIKIINKKIQKKLLDLENGIINDFLLSDSLKGDIFAVKKGVVFELPFGVIRNSTLFANIGPSVPIKMSFLGDVSTELKTSLEDYGLNNAKIELILQTTITTKATMPLSSTNKNIVINSPISIEIIQGNLPDYYLRS